MKALEEQMDTDDVERIKGGIQNLTDAAMKLGQAIYEAEMQKAAEDEDGAADDETRAGAEEDVVDAHFEDVKDDEDGKKG